MRSVEDYTAHWGVTFPVDCSVETACAIMESHLIPGWSWDGFVWEPEELRWLLCARVATHDYVHATRFLMARAAYLALNGPFVVCLSRVREGIAKHGIQFGGIYRHMTLRALAGTLRRQRAVAGTPGGRRREDWRLFLADMASQEREYLHVLEVVSIVPQSATTVSDHPVRSWVCGELTAPGHPSTVLVPQEVSVRVEVEVTGRYRNVMPSPEELQSKLETDAPVRVFRERNGIGTQHDVELERMCAVGRMGGHPVVFWGEEGIEIIRATTNEEKTTLYVVGLDRTMRIQQAGRTPPGSMPRRISMPEGPGAAQGTYVVKFDNGVEDVFTLSFRAHKEMEDRAVALALRCQKRRVASSAEYGTNAIQRAKGTNEGSEIGVFREGREEREWGVGEKGPQIARIAQIGSTLGKADGGTRKAEVVGASGTAKGTDEAAAAAQEQPKVVVVGDFLVVRFKDGYEMTLAHRAKPRAFLRFVTAWCAKRGNPVFLYEEARVEYNRANPSREIRSERLEHDLFKDVEGTSRLFAALDKAAQRFRLLI